MFPSARFLFTCKRAGTSHDDRHELRRDALKGEIGFRRFVHRRTSVRRLSTNSQHSQAIRRQTRTEARCQRLEFFDYLRKLSVHLDSNDLDGETHLISRLRVNEDVAAATSDSDEQDDGNRAAHKVHFEDVSAVEVLELTGHRCQTLKATSLRRYWITYKELQVSRNPRNRVSKVLSDRPSKKFRTAVHENFDLT